MASRAEHYLELARESLEVVAALPDGELRDSMLHMAGTWERLAQEQLNATDLRQRQEQAQHTRYRGSDGPW